MTDKIQVSVTVTNTGTVAGKEVAQLYVSAPTGKMDKPAAELKGFAKTRLLQPGESQELSFDLSAADLASFNTAMSAWTAEAGEYIVKFGNAMQTLISASFKLPKEVMVEKVNKVIVPKVTINEQKRVVAKTKK
jgi:beta-glucosidase